MDIDETDDLMPVKKICSNAINTSFIELNQKEIVSSETSPLEIPIKYGFYHGSEMNKVVRKQFHNNLKWYLYNNNIYSSEGSDSTDQVKLIIMDLYDSERRKFERLKNKFSGNSEEKSNRQKIPENVRIEVWRRDQGCCALCGSRESLEYDHIIPVSKGGSNTTRNIELLCEKCNRSKSNNIQ